MADEQIIVDIQVEDKEVNQAEKSIDRLTDSIEDLGNRIKTARKQNKEYQKQQKELNDLYKAGKISTEQYEKEIDALNNKIKVNNKVIATSKVELGEQNRLRNANIKLLRSEGGSRDELRQKVVLLNKEYNSINKETEEGQKRFQELGEELEKLRNELNAGSLAAGSFVDNIGNYPDVSGAALLSIEELGDGMEAVGGASGKAVGGIKSLGAAFKALLLNPVVLTLTAIVAAASALFGAFKKSASGARIMDKASAILDGVMGTLTKRMNEFGSAAEQSFKRGEDGTVGFWEALKKNVVYRLQSVVELFKAVGDGLKALWEGNTEAIEEASKKAKEALIGIVTGQTIEQLEEIGDKLKETAKDAQELTDAFLKLANAQLKGRETARNLEKGIASTRAELDKLTESAGDDTQAMDKQRDAAIKAGEVAAKLAEQEKALAATRLSLLNQEIAVRRKAGEDIQDLLDEQAEAQVNYTEKVSAAAIAQQKIAIEQRKIERDIFEQNLDILIDVGDKIKTEREKQIQDESLSLEKRKQLLNGARVALEANFDAIKKEYELYGVTAQQINEVINASDAKQANEKLKALGLNEIANNRLREIILERRQAEIDFNDLQKALSDEEISRKQAANDRILEINKENAINQIEEQIKLNNNVAENQEKLKDKLIEFEQERLKILLEDETLLAEERTALTLDTEQRIQEIENEFAEQKKEKDEEDWEERQEIIQDRLDEIVSITEKFAGKEAAIFGKIAQAIGKAFEDGAITATEALDGISTISNAVFDGLTERRQQDLANVEAARARELELAQGNADAQQAINVKYDQLAADLKRKQFNADKAKALVDIAIQTAVAVTKALPNVALSITVGTLGAVQAGIVASKKAPKFAKGVNDIVSIGGSHASGNDVDVWGYSGNQSQYFGKVEKGEAMPVIRKSAINDYLIAKLNGQFSPSKNRGYYQEGTPDVTQAPTQNNEVFVNQLVAAMSNVKIVAKIEDITKEAGKKIQIVDNSKV